MSSLVGLVLLGLACWRLSSLLVREDGPFDIIAKFRTFIGVGYDEYSRPAPKNVIAGVFSCVWCMSVWIGLGFAFLSDYTVNIHTYLITALAISAFAILAETFVVGKM